MFGNKTFNRLTFVCYHYNEVSTHVWNDHHFAVAYNNRIDRAEYQYLILLDSTNDVTSFTSRVKLPQGVDVSALFVEILVYK